MSTPPGMKRRGFLLGAAGLAASLGARSLGLVPASRRPLGDRLARVFRHQESARKVGAEYLRVAPGESRATLLISRITERVPGGSRRLDKLGDDELREVLRRRTVADFAEDRTVVVRGWVLSRTEARLAALASLRGRSPSA